MNMSLVLIAFALAVLMGATFAALLAQQRPGWSERQRLLVAACALPAITLIGSALMIALILLEGGAVEKTMRDLAVAAVIRLGVLFALLAFAGSLAGAALLQARRRR